MSRCFPFYPSEYVRKTKADDLELLKKEKHREKKQKKEKDREKKDSKEKREKEKSDEKHKEKKDKKDKHRDKKKEKDRDKANSKSGSFLADEKRVVGLSGGPILVPSEKSKDRESARGANLVEKRVGELSALSNGEQVDKNSNLVHENKKNPILAEVKKHRNASEFGPGSIRKERIIGQLPDKNVSTDCKNNDVAKSGRIIARPMADGMERNVENPYIQARIDIQGGAEEAKPSGISLVPNSVGLLQNRIGTGRAMEKKADHRVEGFEKIRDKEGDNRERDKQKAKDQEKPIHKDKKREKEKKAEEKGKVKGKEKHIEQLRTKDGFHNHVQKSAAVDGCVNVKETSSAPKDGFKNIAKDENRGSVTLNNLGKRKDIGFNGIYDEHITGPNKLSKTTTSTHSVMENGRILDPCVNTTPKQLGAPVYALDEMQRPPMNIKVDGKERKINGIVSQPLPRHPPQSTASMERKPDAPPKLPPPHPDCKYLSDILSVPKLDEWLGFDDQGWLFNSSSCQTKKPEVDSSGINKTPQVWAKALWLEPGDAYALPYVIPH